MKSSLTKLREQGDEGGLLMVGVQAAGGKNAPFCARHSELGGTLQLYWLWGLGWSVATVQYAGRPMRKVS